MKWSVHWLGLNARINRVVQEISIQTAQFNEYGQICEFPKKIPNKKY